MKHFCRQTRPAVYLILFLLCCTAACTSRKPAVQPAYRNGAVVSAHPEASAVGLRILKQGGNAVDAAVAVQFALAVVYPNAGNLGGGGFMVYRSAAGETASLDFREKAPAAASRDMYLDADGKPIADLSLYGALAAGVPGSVDGMVQAYERYGSLPWAELLEPAIRLAEKGFGITEMQAGELNRRKSFFEKLNPRGAAFIRDGSWQKGDLLVQQELAATLRHIRNQGRRGFYEGETAARIVNTMQTDNGIISLEDLKAYRAVWRAPVTGNYRGYEVISMPPPSSGGVALIGLLQSVAGFPLRQWGFQRDSTVRVMTEAARRIYADRATHLGDPDFYPVPVHKLTDPGYNTGRMADLDFNRATPSTSVSAGRPAYREREETTHFSIVDKDRNAVSITTTLNGSYGSGVVVAGAGFLLNNEMDDFSVKPGAPNMYGLLGGTANAIEPGKRMLSSMTPSILAKDGRLFMVAGTPGGSTIITSVFQTILNVVDFGMTMQQAVSAPRFHHQWMPDEIAAEAKAIDSMTRQKLENSGYLFKNRGSIGRVDAILIDSDGSMQAGADHRGDDTAAGY